MSGKFRSFAIFAIILLTGAPSARALKCYQCNSNESDSCASKPEQKELLTCEVESSTLSPTESTDSSITTTESTDSSTTTTESTDSSTTTTESADSSTTTTEVTNALKSTEENNVSSTTTESASSMSTESASSTSTEENSPVDSGTKDVDGIKDGSKDNKVPARERRSILMNRFSRGETYDDKLYCFQNTITVNEKEVVYRGCTSDEKYCDNEGKDGKSCDVCDTEGCNSLASAINPLYTTMILSLALTVFYMK